jgi:hypothetical protein
MLITVIRKPFEMSPTLTIGVSEFQVDAVVRALMLDGWHLLDKMHWPVSPIFDALQVAVLEARQLPADAPIRVAVERCVSAAIENRLAWLDPHLAVLPRIQ